MDAVENQKYEDYKRWLQAQTYRCVGCDELIEKVLVLDPTGKMDDAYQDSL